tara:strand:+ start:240 stop:473 length:234 start_codon:yes stop_codon:yes gene_type:complete
MREILDRTVEGTITGTYLMYWYPSLPRSQWTKAFDLSKEECTKEHTWTMGSRKELEGYAKYHAGRHGMHKWELISTQ